MASNKGGRGHRDPNALRRKGVRGPLLKPTTAKLLETIVQERGGSKEHHIFLALVKYATEEEVIKSDLVE